MMRAKLKTIWKPPSNAPHSWNTKHNANKLREHAMNLRLNNTKMGLYMVNGNRYGETGSMAGSAGQPVSPTHAMFEVRA